MTTEVVLDGASLTVSDLARVAKGAPVRLDAAARARMAASAAWYAAHGPPDVLADKLSWLAGLSSGAVDEHRVRSVVLSHCAGVGEPLPVSVVRAMIAARVNVLATGLTGCRPQVADALLGLLRVQAIPVVPGLGSVGAAGDAQLAHVARVVCGWGGQVWQGGQRVGAAAAMQGLSPLRPTPKEALSLINGPSYPAALAALVCEQAGMLLQTAVRACGLTFEVVRADVSCLAERALAARGHPGAVQVAAQLREQLAGSQLATPGRRPDPFSIRCAPAVLGAALETLHTVEQVLTRELNGAGDNPLVFAPDTCIEAGNFHGASIGLAMDQLKVALTQVASMSERRAFRMTHGQLSGLPSFLVRDTGLNNGLMLAQYTAASLVSECKVLSHPASVDSLPTVQHREDHVSLAPVAARGARRVAEALADVLAIELLCGAQGVDLWLESQAALPSQANRTLHRKVRERVDLWTQDRVLYPDLRIMGEAVRNRVFVY